MSYYSSGFKRNKPRLSTQTLYYIRFKILDEAYGNSHKNSNREAV